MKSKNSFYAMAGLVALLIVGNISAVYFGDLLLTKKSESLMSVKLESRVLDEQQISIKQAKKDIEKYQGLEKIAGSIVPQDKDQAEAVREIIKIAGAATNYKSGTTVRLTPQPSEGYQFKGWSGDDTTSRSTLDLIVSKAINLTWVLIDPKILFFKRRAFERALFQV